MTLSINPNTPQIAVVNSPICFEGSAVVVIPGSGGVEPLDIPASGLDWTYDSGTQFFTRVSGGPPGYASATTTSVVYGLQPFYIRGANSFFQTPGAPNNNSHCFIGVEDDQNRRYVIEFMKYCNNNTSSCNATSGSNWLINIIINGSSVYVRTVNFNEIFYVRSDGVNLIFEHVQAGVFITDYVIPLPGTATWKFIVGAGYTNNVINLVSTWKGTYQGTVPITWSAPLGGVLSGTATNQCFTSDTPGSYEICIDSDFDDPLCVDIEVSDLYINPEDLPCGRCVFVNEIVKFESNGGLAGTLNVYDTSQLPTLVSVGTIIDALTWQAPSFPVNVTAVYTLGTNQASCEIGVVEEFKIINVIGDTITGLVPGDTFQLESNFISDGNQVVKRPVVWTNLDCQNLVSPSGLITIPKNYRSSCFGAIDCYIRGTVVDFPDANCPNLENGSVFKDFRIIVDPVYPTPDFGGPNWEKWKPETPDFRVISKTTEGGCSETHIRNRVPIMRWTVSYRNLTYEDIDPCVSSSCDDTAGYVGGFDPRFQTAKMLDDFWMLVAGEHKTFTLIDPRTKYVWRNVRFENKVDRDHINWRRTQSRTMSLIWNPCCDTDPMGGVCVHSTVVTDNVAPTVPQNIDATEISSSRIDVTWDAALDNVGIHYYELEIDGLITNVGNVLLFKHKGLTPVSTHFYRVRAVDYSNNLSAWSDEVQATTLGGSSQFVQEYGNDIEDGTDLIIEG